MMVVSFVRRRGIISLRLLWVSLDFIGLLRRGLSLIGVRTLAILMSLDSTRLLRWRGSVLSLKNSWRH